nr:LytTR family DNA-binding domain-containing protein [Haliscomenobacter sp.]
MHELLYAQDHAKLRLHFYRKGRYLTLCLKTVEENLDAGQFIRVHKSYIVSSSKIDSIENHELFIAGTSIPISRNLREVVLEKVVKDRLLKKP